MHSALAQIKDMARSVIDVLLPEKARATRVRRLSAVDFILTPQSHDLRSIHITTLLDYKDRGVSDLIRALKYEHSGHAADIAASILADYLQEEIANIKLFSPRGLLLVPMALHPDRVSERGFNQVEKILKRLPKELRDGTVATLASHALARIRATPQQTRLSRSERIKNVSGAFAADSQQVHRKKIILVDDVTTTGATLAESAKTLKLAGAEVIALALARA